MNNVVLTEQDITDISCGYTINVMDENGSEHILGPDLLNEDDLEYLENGGIVDFEFLNITYPHGD